MEFGVPKEIRDLETRVGLTPAGVQALIQAGHTVYIEQDAGVQAGFSNETYRKAGANMVYSATEAYGRADILIKVTRPTAQEHHLFRPSQTICAFLHLAVSSPDLLEAFATSNITAIAHEMIEEEDGHLPLLAPLSEAAGRLAPIIAGQLLMNTSGNRGTLLSGIPGVPPATVVILGAGSLGLNAARAFLGSGAQVTVLDRDVSKLHRLDELFMGRATTMISNDYTLNLATSFADVLVGCVLTPGERAPVLVSREMVSQMRTGAVIIDFAIDNGGCIATSRPTTLRDPIFVADGIIHHCVPNITASVARTTSYALTNSILPYLLNVSKYGLTGMLEKSTSFMRGINFYQGKLVNNKLSAALGRAVDFVLPIGGNA